MLLLMACLSESVINGVKNNPGAGGPDISVDPTQIDFGSLDLGDTTTGSFTIRNEGDEGSILNVSGVRIEGDPGFSILSETLTAALGTGDSRDILIEYTPLGAQNEARAIISSDDPDEAEVEVLLTGTTEATFPELQIDPDPLDLGQTYLGCYAQNTLTLRNVGTGTLSLTDMGENGDAFSLLGKPSLPLDLAPGETTTVDVLFVPYEEQAFTGGITVTSNEPASPRTSPHRGEGVMLAETTDHWEIPSDPPTDIMFFVDQSCSMDDDAAAVARNFAGFITQLSSFTTDWQVMVVNDDNGCNDGGILTSTTPNYDSTFETAVTRGGGTWTEAGLTVTSTAVDKTDRNECNDGFMRAGALLHIVMVSDEPEQSISSWDTYVNQVIAKKGNAGLVKFSAIAGDMPRGCSSNGNSADAGTGYYDASVYTNGVFLSLCSDWANDVGTLANASIEQSIFTLSSEAIESTLVVMVNGSRRTGGWTYDANTNSVVFTIDIPAEGDLVDISYHPYADCQQ